jgi:hypothetical protein
VVAEALDPVGRLLRALSALELEGARHDAHR